MCRYRRLICLSPWLLTAILLIWPGIRYVVQDDLVLAQIVRGGAFGCRFFSGIAGRALYGLSALKPGVEWYDVWLLASLSAGFGMLHWTALRWEKRAAHAVLWLAQASLTLAVFTFTTAAMVCVFAGAAALLLTRGERRWPVWLAALLLVFNGCCMRRDGVLICCGGLLAPLAVLNGGFSWKRLGSAAAIAAVCAAIWAGIGLTDRALIGNDAALREYSEFESARSALMDGRQSAPDEARLAEAGILTEDLLLVRSNFYADAERLDEEWFQRCAGVLNEGGSPMETLRTTAGRAANLLHERNPQLLCALATAICALALGLARRRALPCALAMAVMLGLETAYLICVDRYLDRVAAVMNWLCALGVGAAYLSAAAQKRRTGWLRGIAAACLAVMVVAAGRHAVRFYDYAREAERRHEQMADADGLLLSSSVSLYTADLRVRAANGPDRLTPNLLADWELYSPWWRQQMVGAGLEDHCDYAFGALLEDGVALVVADGEQDAVGLLERYMERRDGVGISVEIAPLEGLDRFSRCVFTEEIS